MTEFALPIALGFGLYLLSESRDPEKALHHSRRRKLHEGQVHQKQFLERPHASQAKVDRTSRSLSSLFSAVATSQSAETAEAKATFNQTRLVNNAPRERSKVIARVAGTGHRTLKNPKHTVYHHVQGQGPTSQWLAARKFLSF